jgi:hypothetical protein
MSRRFSDRLSRRVWCNAVWMLIGSAVPNSLPAEGLCVNLRDMQSYESRVALRLAVWLSLLLAPFCIAQNQISKPPQAGAFSLESGRLPLTSLDGLWRFHAGDDPGFSSPAFDDSAWPLVHSDQSWAEQHLPIAVNTFWYRTRILIPAGTEPLSLYLPEVFMSYQVYRDGQLIGGLGAMPPHPHMTTSMPMVFEISPGSSPQPRILLLAIRCWRWPRLNRAFAYGLSSGIRIGATPLIRQNAVLETHQLFWDFAAIIFLTLLEGIAPQRRIKETWLRCRMPARPIENLPPEVRLPGHTTASLIWWA